MVRPVRDEHGVGAEPVQDHTGQRTVEPHPHGGGLPSEHAEDVPAIGGQVELLGLRSHIPGLTGGADFHHLVHPVMGDSVAGRMGHQIVIFLVPDQPIGAGLIGTGTVVALAVHAPFEIPEGNPGILGNGLVELVYIVKDALVHGLDAAGNHHLALERPGLMGAGQAAELGNQLHGFLCGEKLRRLNRIHQQF